MKSGHLPRQARAAITKIAILGALGGEIQNPFNACACVRMRARIMVSEITSQISQNAGFPFRFNHSRWEVTIFTSQPFTFLNHASTQQKRGLTEE